MGGNNQPLIRITKDLLKKKGYTFFWGIIGEIVSKINGNGFAISRDEFDRMVWYFYTEDAKNNKIPKAQSMI